MTEISTLRDAVEAVVAADRGWRACLLAVLLIAVVKSNVPIPW